jgi:hypothetical protein
MGNEKLQRKEFLKSIVGLKKSGVAEIEEDAPNPVDPKKFR